MSLRPEGPSKDDRSELEFVEPVSPHRTEQDEACATLLALVAEAPGRGGDAQEAGARPQIAGLVVGRLASLEGGALVSWPRGREPRPVRSMAALGPEHVGRDVALLFEQGDPTRPVIVGVMEPDPPQAPAAARPSSATSDGCPPLELEATACSPLQIEPAGDGERVVLSAEREVVLRCGEASITLTRAGKIILKGAYVVTHSTGVNRIRGAKVEIN